MVAELENPVSREKPSGQHVMPARSEAGQERTKIRDAPSWFALILRMDAHILLPRSMRPGSRDRSEQAVPAKF